MSLQMGLLLSANQALDPANIGGSLASRSSAWASPWFYVAALLVVGILALAIFLQNINR